MKAVSQTARDRWLNSRHKLAVKTEPNPAPLLIPQALATALMRLYDYPDPRRSGRLIRGYDRPHALRTARMCGAVALRLGHQPDRLVSYQIACLLHDLGRAGLDRRLFGRIWSWAKRRGVPTRPREWRAAHPETPYGRETEAFLARYKDQLESDGIRMDGWAKEQVEMRLGYARRLARRLRAVKPSLKRLGVPWSPWMGLVMLYYYYPEKLSSVPRWVHQLAEVLVACEQFEAYNNRRRGQDYYARTQETLEEAFAYLEKLRVEGVLTETVMYALYALAAEGSFDSLLAEARGAALTSRELRYLRGLTPGAVSCR